MKTNHSRRKFIKKSSKIGLACGILAICPKINSFGNFIMDEVPDPKKLNYCGFTCSPNCKMYVAAIENDIAKKREAYEKWKLKEKYGLEFDPEQVFCYRCKSGDKPLGIVVRNCSVRKCAVEKGIDCCIECDNLKSCDKELWKDFPEFHKQVIGMQDKFNEATSKE